VSGRAPAAARRGPPTLEGDPPRRVYNRRRPRREVSAMAKGMNMKKEKKKPKKDKK
jgi:hypothetical protein